MHTIDFERLDLDPGDRVLDLGCGDGRHATGLAWHARAEGPADLTVVGVDIDPERLRAARTERRDLGLDGSPTFALGDATGLPFETDSFDVAVCAEVLEHLPAYGRALDELDRVLRPGGTLAVSVPRYWPERVCWALSDGYHEVEGGHVRIFRRGHLTGAIESRNFELWDSHHAHALHAPYWWLKCLWWDRTEAEGADADATPTPLSAYERVLEWSIVADPTPVDKLEELLNPVLGKSLVLYFDSAGESGSVRSS